MRARHRLSVLLGLLLGVGCQAQRQAGPSLTPPPWSSTGLTAFAPGARALVVENGQERWLDAGDAERQGFTLVDLSDDFTPILFADQGGHKNAYRSTFVGLANDRLDSDGQPLAAGSENYLELYGIFPSFSVLSRRFAAQAGRRCLDEGSRAVWAGKLPSGKVSAETWKALAARLGCESLLAASAGHKPGRFDRPLLLALRRFQLKHMIYEGAHLRGNTRETLGRDLLENNHRALLRVLRERVVAATGIIEDGSGSRALGPAANLADDYTAIAARALGVDTPEGAEAFLRRRPPGAFGRLLAAVKLPPRPLHYDEALQLKLVIDRGDVYYDPPFDEAGQPVRQPRKKYPTLTLVGVLGKKELALVRWRTTIGGWRLEQASDGYEYYRYKGSDVGPRVMRQIIAGPVWLAPPATPVRSLVKWKVVGGRSQRVVDYSELGPGYLSAYGLVAGYFVIPGKDGRPDRDNGIRAHGSAEYLSMYSADGYSHGCHRLPNHLAIRLYSFLLRHRPVRVQGQLEGVASRQFLHGENVFEVRIHSRGFGYELDPPLPVEVRAGNIRGERKEPVVGYLPQPGVQYPGPPPPLPGASPEQLAAR
jgi:hypothetical protein